jgi:DNA polymerase elongation subunit (family B)
MVRRLQPCDWQERDVGNYYVIDAYGRSPEKEVVRVRIVNFRPYFYVKTDDGEPIPFGGSIRMTKEDKYDIFAGFNGFKTTEVYKVECQSLNEYRDAIKFAKSMNATLYEANIPPFLRFFHARDVQPASPLLFQPLKEDPNKEKEEVGCHACYIADYRDVSSDPSQSIPLKILSYDLEVYSESGQFPVASNASDEIIQIGATIRWTNDLMTPIARKVFVLGTVTEDPLFHSCPSEADLLSDFADYIAKENPDVLCGYNTFGFDDKYMIERAQFRKLKLQFGRVRVGNPYRPKPLTETLLEHKVFDIASGKYDVNFLRVPGRLSIDLLLNMRREHNLDSYKLDNVASTFLRDKVVRMEQEGAVTRIYTKSTRGLRAGNYVRFDIVGNTTDPYHEGEKFSVLYVRPNYFEIQSTGLFEDLDAKTRKSLEWTFTKDDIHPQDIFRMQKGTPEDRATIARYCIQDCDLVLTIMAKLDTIVNARGMADVCIVPMQFLFLRGQGIKIYSRVAYEASKRNQIIMTQEAMEGDATYEGAIVIPPKIGMYLDQPISVLDYNSLYPSSMILENLSPDSFVCEKVYNESGKLISYDGLKPEVIQEYKNQGYTFNEIRYSVDTGMCTCIFLEPPKGNPLGVGIIPTALQVMLQKRKETRLLAEKKDVTLTDGSAYLGALLSEQNGMVTIKTASAKITVRKEEIARMQDVYDDSQKAVFNGLQLAYKVVANSMYGQLGSRTSPIRKMCVAACTTAVGRRQLLFAKDLVEREYGAEVVYGDTDSIFIKFQTKDLAESIQLGMEAADKITETGSKNPGVMKIGYEKTFYPFILFCRKRYVGMLYEDDPTAKPKRKSMGIVLKRRDNAPIVKDVFGGALDMLLDRKTIPEAAAFVQEMLIKVLENQVPIEKFVITKQLRDDYKDPTKIAHRVLADRMADRDPGSAPNVGDRLQFVYIKNTSQQKKVLQGDRIEALEYVKEKGLQPDTMFYITNQIQNPVAQLFALCIEQIPGYREPRPTYAQLFEQLQEEKELDEEEATLKVLDKKEQQLESLLFLDSPTLSRIVRRSQSGPLDSFFKKSSKA